MKIDFIHGLPFVELVIEHDGKKLTISNVLVDTGSATSVFSTDLLATIDVMPQGNDALHRIQGVGGYEYVIQKTVDRIQFENTAIEHHIIQLGDLDYGFDIHGIVGSDILEKMGAVVNFSTKTLLFQ